MTKQAKIVLGIVAVLAVVVAVFAFLNKENVSQKNMAQQSGTFTIYAGQEKIDVTMADIEGLQPFDITANYKKSGKPPETKTFSGVSFKAVADAFSIDYASYTSVSFTAADGYASALSAKQAMDDSNCFIVISQDGIPLGNKESGGSGPFMMILAGDEFSQKWCKFLLEVKFE